MSIDKFLDRIPRKDYNCLDFVREVWLELFGTDVAARLNSLCAAIHAVNGKFNLTGVRGFKALDRPVSPCFVVMQRPKLTPHIGIYLDGRVLHMHTDGVEFQPLTIARRYFTRVGYYR